MGIITVEEVEGVPDFYMLRKPEQNPNFKLENKLGILWRPELSQIQQKYGMAKYKDKRKSFVIDKICGLVPDIISMDELSETISSILFERDYNQVEEALSEYRKGELQKRIEQETDPGKRLELMMEQAEKSKNFAKRKRKRRRR